MGLHIYGGAAGTGGWAPDGRLGQPLSESVREQIRAAAAVQQRTSQGIGLLDAAIASLDALDRDLLEIRRIADTARAPGCDVRARRQIQQHLDQVVARVEALMDGSDHAGIRALGGAAVVESDDGVWAPDDGRRLGPLEVDGDCNSGEALERIDRLRTQIEQERAGLGGVARALIRTADRVSVASHNLRASGCGLHDADLAAVMLDSAVQIEGGRMDRARSSQSSAARARMADAARQ